MGKGFIEHSDEKVTEAILKAREIFCSRSTTQEQYTGMIKMLCYNLIHCSDKIEDIVRGTLLEAERRLAHFEILWINDKIKKELASKT